MSSPDFTQNAIPHTAHERATATARRDPVAGRPAPRSRRARTIFEYRRYSAFVWDWSWRRCIVFASFTSLIVIWAGLITGVALGNRQIGLAMGFRSAEIFILAICVGPLAASWVRSRKWPLRWEMIAVIAAVILGVASSIAFQSVGNRYANPFLRGLETRALVANPMVLLGALERSPLAMISRCILFLFLSGGLAVPSYLAGQRRLLQEAREREVGELQLQKRETDLQLLVLQAQIEPHFLFNTLASLRSLLRQDVERAETMVDALVEHLRAVMPVFRENTQSSTLSEQLRICSSYLELMRVRLPDRLTYIIDVPEALRSAAFPPLILLTLVENAVKHGIEPKPGSGHIRIDARREHRTGGAHIRVSVTDNGAGLSAGLGHGVGLSNIRAQLTLKYGDRAALSLTSGAKGGAVASIYILESDSDESAFSAEESGGS